MDAPFLTLFFLGFSLIGFFWAWGVRNDNLAMQAAHRRFLAELQAEIDARSRAHKRAMDLLRRCLSPQQLASFDTRNFFEVVGGETGRVYRIDAHGVAQLDNIGNPAVFHCFYPEGELARGDRMLGQKIALEVEEMAALQIANSTSMV